MSQNSLLIQVISFELKVSEAEDIQGTLWLLNSPLCKTHQ